MITKEFKNCKDLKEYYNKVLTLQQLHHGISYTLVHDELKRLLKNCDSYTEFGVAQGGTLAIPCLNGIKKVRGYEINLQYYNKASKYFDLDIDFKVINESTLTTSPIDEVDLLYIDSVHTCEHLTKELNRHAHNVNKYIVMHDTFSRQLMPSIKRFIEKNKEWKIITNCTDSVGFVSIAK